MVILQHGPLLSVPVQHRLLANLAQRAVDLLTLEQLVHVHGRAPVSILTFVGEDPGTAGGEEIFQHPRVPFLNREALQNPRGAIGTASIFRLQTQPRPPARIQQQVSNLFG